MRGENHRAIEFFAGPILEAVRRHNYRVELRSRLAILTEEQLGALAAAYDRLAILTEHIQGFLGCLDNPAGGQKYLAYLDALELDMAWTIAEEKNGSDCRAD